MCWGEGGVEGIGLVKKLKWDLVTIRIRKYNLKGSKIVTLKDQKVQWGVGGGGADTVCKKIKMSSYDQKNKR